MIRLHFWTIVLDLCINAKADRPAPAVSVAFGILDREKQCLFPGPLTSDVPSARPHDSLDRSKPTSSGLSWLRPHAAGGKADSRTAPHDQASAYVRPHPRSHQSQLVQLWNTVYWVRVLITRGHELGFLATRCALHIVMEKCDAHVFKKSRWLSRCGY